MDKMKKPLLILVGVIILGLIAFQITGSSDDTSDTENTEAIETESTGVDVQTGTEKAPE